MKRASNKLAAFAAVFLMIFGAAGELNAQTRGERQVRDIVRSLNSKVDDFRYYLAYQLRSGSADVQELDDVSRSLQNLQDKIDAFQQNLDLRRENRSDVQAIVTAARDVDAFLAQNRQNRAIEADWEAVRGLISRLANNYGFRPDWSTRISAAPGTTRDTYGTPVPPRSSAASGFGLTGTYRLDTARSEKTADIISSTGVGAGNRQDLESKLDAPEQIALDVRGSQVTLATSKASPVTFTADGSEKVEQSGTRTVRLRAAIRGDELQISSLGGETDYTLIFTPLDNGQTLRVTRRITTDYLRETVFAESFYNRTDQIARLGIDTVSSPPDNTGYSSNDPTDRPGYRGGTPTAVPGRTGKFIVPDGTMVTGMLENMIDTDISQNGDRFRLTVQSPDAYRGAVIEGFISGVGSSGRVSGSSNVTFNFESITLRSGETYDFAGNLMSVKDQYGKTVKVDTEGVAKGDSQTRETVKRGGIGAGLGAVIGAIAGGAKGAAIGAVIGGGAGAGSVVVQGRDDIQLMKGSVLTIQSSSPVRAGDPYSQN